jgi:hypothetical protein
MLAINVAHLLEGGDSHDDTFEASARPGVPLFHVTVPAWLLDESPRQERQATEADPMLGPWREALHAMPRTDSERA